MKIALIQTDIFWENPTANCENLTKKINEIKHLVDLIVLPEMFTSGFSMNPKNIAETMNGDTLNWLKKTASEKNCAITGSLAIEENSNYYNRMVFVHPNGNIDFYDKKHLFTLAGEHQAYTAGNQKTIVTYKNIKICLQVCYDLRFPVFVRNTENYDLLIYVASWPITRIAAWDALLKARAIENQCMVAGVNRTGIDGNNLVYPGRSQLIDELGNHLIAPTENEAILEATIDFEKVMETRNKLNFLNDRDEFVLV